VETLKRINADNAEFHTTMGKLGLTASFNNGGEAALDANLETLRHLFGGTIFTPNTEIMETGNGQYFEVSWEKMEESLQINLIKQFNRCWDRDLKYHLNDNENSNSIYTEALDMLEKGYGSAATYTYLIEHIRKTLIKVKNGNVGPNTTQKDEVEKNTKLLDRLQSYRKDMVPNSTSKLTTNGFICDKISRLLEKIVEHHSWKLEQKYDYDSQGYPVTKIIIFIRRVIDALMMKGLLNYLLTMKYGQKNKPRLMCNNEELDEINYSYVVVGAKHQSTAKRESNIKLFKHTKGLSVMCATDAAEVGIDIQECISVILYDQVDTTRAYIQRSGRARADNRTIYTFSGNLSNLRECEERMYDAAKEAARWDAVVEEPRKLVRKKKDGKTVYPIELSNSKGEVITFLAANTADGELNKMAQKLHNSNGLQEFVNDKDKTGRVLIIDNENKQLRWVALNHRLVLEVWTNLLDEETYMSLHAANIPPKKQQKKMMSFIILLLLFVNNCIDEKMRPTQRLQLALNQSAGWPDVNPNDKEQLLFFKKENIEPVRRDLFQTNKNRDTKIKTTPNYNISREQLSLSSLEVSVMSDEDDKSTRPMKEYFTGDDISYPKTIKEQESAPFCHEDSETSVSVPKTRMDKSQFGNIR